MNSCCRSPAAKLIPSSASSAHWPNCSRANLGLFQVLFQPAQTNRGRKASCASVTHADGKPFFVDSPELAGAAENKVARPLFAAVVRILVCAGERERMLQLARDLAGSLRVFAHPNGNKLIPLKNDDYPFENHIEDVLQRQSRRSGMILNSDELIGFVHLPSSAVRSPVFQRQTDQDQSRPDDCPAWKWLVAWKQRPCRRRRLK